VLSVLDARDFEFDGGRVDAQTSRFTRELAEHWCFDGRAFGGYTSALALSAVFAHTGRSAATSLAVTFVEAGVPGPIEIETRTLRGGRSAEAVEARIHQNGHTVLVAHSWLADGWAGPPSVHAPVPFQRFGTGDSPLPDPADGSSLEWLRRKWPPLRFGRRSGIDYPESLRGFNRGHPEVALWVAVDIGADADDGGATDPLSHPQIADVLHADAHLFDSPAQVTGFVETWLLSLDLVISWQPGAHLLPSTSWRLFEGRGSVTSGGVTAYGSLRARDGSLLAVMTSQGLVR
jgi:hypothetical protein